MRPIDADAYGYPGDLINEPTLTLDDVVPHGRWIEKQEAIPWCDDDVEVYWECSVCETPCFGRTPYCPNCGAKMDLEG